MLRSINFTIGFYLGSALILVISSPLLLGKRKWAMAALTFYCAFVLWWLKLSVGTSYEVRGIDNLPKGAVLIAAKHQSAWETFILPYILNDPALIMKEELMAIPIYGWFSKKFEMIPIKRERAAIALREMIKEAQLRKIQGREIIIFPEGTRKEQGDAPDYKAGVIKLYEGLNIPCIPVALNSGLFWPKQFSKHYKGTIIIEFLPAIPPGVERKEFRARLESDIELKCEELWREGLAERKRLN